MKIQLLSDTHSDLSRFRINDDADIIAHCGDFTKGYKDSVKHIIEFTDLCEENDKPYVLVFGNHDYYGYNYRDELLKELDEYGINYLTVGKVFDFKGYRFIGDTLFTEFNLYFTPDLSSKIAEAYINDFKNIFVNDKNIDSKFMIKEWYDQYSWINTFRNVENLIVLSHFVPSKIMIQEQYKGNELNPYFINDLNLYGFKTWLCGHSHFTGHFKNHGCDIHINASGYTSYSRYECPHFDTNYLINV